MAARDAAKARRVPAELRGEMARAGSLGESAWAEARRTGDLTTYLPSLARVIDLRRSYIECFDDFEHPYDALLDDYEPGMRTAEVAPLLADLRAGLVPLARLDRGERRRRRRLAPERVRSTSGSRSG